MTAFGVVVLITAVVIWLRRSDKLGFPAILVAAGLFLCGADAVKVNVSGVGLEFDRQVASATQSNAEAVIQQGQLLQALSGQVDQLAKAVGALQAANSGSSSASKTSSAALATVNAHQAEVSAGLQRLRSVQLRASAASARLNGLLSGRAPAGE